MAQSDHYHVWHRAAFDPLPAWSNISITVPTVSGVGTESKTVYSLKKDMDQLRADGKAKGIVDDTVISLPTKSVEGRELWVLKVGNGSAVKVLFTGCHHSREWISVEMPYLVAEYLIQTYKDPPTNDKEKRIKHLLMNREIWFIPMVNPDGHEYTLTGPMVGGRPARMWRANRKAYALPGGTITAPKLGGGSRSFPYPAGTYTGVDLNRNYNTLNWGQETFRIGDPNPTTSRNPQDCGAANLHPTWCGPGPTGSTENESKAIDDIFRLQKFKASITYHNFSQLLLFPDASSGDTFVQFVGKGMRDLIAEKGNPYTYESGSALYATTGDLMEFSYEISPGRPTFTPEVRPPDPPPAGWDFSGLPETEIKPCFVENLAAALALINCAGMSAPDGGTTCTWQFGWPPRICQVVPNCWEVFKGWTP